jgi:hypothetical protein
LLHPSGGDGGQCKKANAADDADDQHDSEGQFRRAVRAEMPIGGLHAAIADGLVAVIAARPARVSRF